MRPIENWCVWCLGIITWRVNCGNGFHDSVDLWVSQPSGLNTNAEVLDALITSGKPNESMPGDLSVAGFEAERSSQPAQELR